MRVDISNLRLDPSGRVQLDDEALTALALTAATMVAGQAQSNLTTCTNELVCHDSRNGACTNVQGQCNNATNRTRCMIIRG